jgi:hypothetical protein
MSSVQRAGFSSAKPYLSVVLAETKGRSDVQIDKALAIEGEKFVDVIVPASTGFGGVSLRIDRAMNVIKRTSIAVTETAKDASFTVVEDGKTIVDVKGDKATNTASGYIVQNGERVEFRDQALDVTKDNAPGTCGTVREWWGCMGNCFSSLGISGFLLGLIGLACGLCETVVGCIVCALLTGFVLVYQVAVCEARCFYLEPLTEW